MKSLSVYIITLVAGLFMISATLSAKEQKEKKPKEEKKENKKEEKKEDTVYNSSLVGGLKFRSISPAFTSGRIADIAVNPQNHSE